MTTPYTVQDLPEPPAGKTGWPWTEGSAPLPEGDWPSITVVIPSFNQGEYLEQCLRSVLLQAYPGLSSHLRDGGSSDQSVGIIEKYASFFDSCTMGPDDGQCAAINSVLLEADSTLAGWMNTDDFYMPDAMRHAAEALQAEPEHVLWAGNTEEIDTEDQHVRYFPPKIGEGVADLAHWYLKFGFHQPSAFFRTGTFKEIGGLDRNLETCLDVELWLRMRRAGSFGITEQVISTVRNNPESKAIKFSRRQMVELLAVMHRNDQLDAALWRLDEFEKKITTETIHRVRELAEADEVLLQYSSKELLASILGRIGGRGKGSKD